MQDILSNPLVDTYDPFGSTGLVNPDPMLSSMTTTLPRSAGLMMQNWMPNMMPGNILQPNAMPGTVFQTSRRYHRRRVVKSTVTRNAAGGPLGSLGYTTPTTSLLGWDVDSDFYPPMDVIETDEAIHVFLEVPGIKRESIALDIQESRLILSGEKETDDELDLSDNVRLLERDTGKFKRILRLMQGCDADRIEAEVKNGLLEVKIPKKEGLKMRIQIA